MPEKLVIRIINSFSRKRGAKQKKPKEIVVYYWNRIFAALFVIIALFAVLIWGGLQISKKSIYRPTIASVPAANPMETLPAPVINVPTRPVQPAPTPEVFADTKTQSTPHKASTLATATLADTEAQSRPHKASAPAPATLADTKAQSRPHKASTPAPATLADTEAQSRPHKASAPAPATLANTKAQSRPHKASTPAPAAFAKAEKQSTLHKATTPAPATDFAAATVPAKTPGYIKRVQLTSGIKEGEPVDKLGRKIHMNAKGLIRVYLFMEAIDLEGKVLFHDWYWKCQRMAHVRIPIKSNPQTAASSKYIDRIMVGPWVAKIVDERNRILAKEVFNVQ